MMTPEELFQARRLGQKKKFRPIVQLAPETEAVVAEYECLADAARAVGGSVGAIYAVATGKSPTAYAFLWRFKEDMLR